MPSTGSRQLGPRLAFAVVLAGAIVVALAGSGYLQQIAGDALAFGIAAMGLDFLVGYTGRVSFGQAAWLALGGFVSGTFLVHGWDLITATLVTLAIVGLLAAALGAIATATGGLAFAIITLAQGEIIYTIVNHLGIFGAGVGLFGVELPKIAGLSLLSSQRSLYLFALALALLSYLALRWLVHSPAGRFCQAVRDDETRARSIGVEVRRHQVLAFVAASMVAAVGGIVFVVLNAGIAPSQGEWDQSGLILVMLIIGGVGTLYGPFIGAFIYVFAQSYLSQGFANTWQIYLGSIFVALVLLLPGGVASGLRFTLAGLARLLPVAGRTGADASPEHTEQHHELVRAAE